MKVLTVFGTRPEAIKLAPVLGELARQGIPHRVCVTSQHREMLDPFLQLFDIRADYDLAIMKSDQDLYHVTIAVLLKIRDVLRIERPDVVIVQGDTTTTLAASLAAYYEKIPIAHVEAGLRTREKYGPFPEEMNRRLVDHLADWLFAPTERAAQNLHAEGLPQERIFVTGNPVVDTLHSLIEDERFCRTPLPIAIPKGRKLVLVTAHRRESFGEKLKSICQAIRELAKRHNDVEIVYPVHLNPNVRELVFRTLRAVERVHLLEPLEYLPFLKLMERATLILTDSGGVQEEAPTFGVPVLVLRETTERPEGLEAGVAKLVGPDPERIVEEASRLLEDSAAYARMTQAENPYGDGRAAERIVRVLKDALS